ncbi:MAG: WD40 repeat domain-containing protein [Gemmataceae bacterium]
MTRVVCQVLVHPERVTFRWSDGARRRFRFEPYWLEQSHLEQFWSAAGTLNSKLAELARSVSNQEDPLAACYSVAQAGYALYEQIFVPDPNFGDLTKEIQEWLDGLQGELDSFEVVGDTTGLVPWQAVFASQPTESAFQETAVRATCEAGFWGLRYPLAVANRVNAFRAEPVVAAYDAVVVLDTEAKEDLTLQQRERLDEFGSGDNVHLAHSVEDLTEILNETAPDVMYLLSRVDDGKLRFGEDEFSLPEFRELLMKAVDRDVPWNQVLVFLAATEDTAEANRNGNSEWNAFRSEWLRLRLGGLVLPDHVVPLTVAHSLLFDMFAKLCEDTLPVAQAVRQVRQSSPFHGLLCSALCPPDVKFPGSEETSAGEEREGEPNETAIRAAPGETDSSQESSDARGFPESPYRPLVPFDQDDRLLLVGRDRDIQGFSDLVDSPDVRIGFLHGRVGVGKSSLLRAGVIPNLQDHAIGYQGLRNRSDEEAEDEDEYSVIAIRSTQDLVGQLAIALRAFSDVPYSYTTPTNRTVVVDLPALLRKTVDGEPVAPLSQVSGVEPSEAITAEEPTAAAKTSQGTSGADSKSESDAEGFAPVSAVELRKAMLADSELFSRILLLFAQNLPYEPVLLVEHGEELYSLTQDSGDIQLRLKALDVLRTFGLGKGHGKIIFSIRTEYLARLRTRLIQGLSSFPSRAYLLSALNLEQLTGVIELPTTFEVLPGAKTSPRAVYQFDYEIGLPEQIAVQALRESNAGTAEALPLIHIICSQLYDVAALRPERVVTAQDLAKLMKNQGGVAQYLQLMLSGVASGRDAKALQQFLPELVGQQSDGAVVRKLILESDADAAFRGRTPFTGIVAAGTSEEVPLFEEVLVIDNDDETSAVSLSHDSLAFAASSLLTAQDKTKGTWKAVIDTLFICVPVLILVVTYFIVYWVRPYRELAETHSESVQTIQKVVDINKAQQEQIRGNSWRHYVDAVHRAKIASEGGDVIRMRQLLGPYRGFGRNNFRGFEWYYLWKKAHPARHEFENHLGNVVSLALSADSEFALTGGADGQVILWNLEFGREIPLLSQRGKSVGAVAFHPDSDLCALALADNSIVVVSLTDKEPPKRLKSHTQMVHGLLFAQEGKTLVSASEDGKLLVWDTKEGKLKKAMGKEALGRPPIKMFTSSADGKIFAVSKDGSEIALWDATSERNIGSPWKASPVAQCFALSPDGGILATGHRVTRAGLTTGQIRLWDVATRKETLKPIEQDSPAVSLSFAPGGTALLTGGADHQVRVWNYKTGQFLRGYAGHIGSVNHVAATPDGKFYVSAGKDSTVRVWDVQPAARVISAHQDWICTFAASEDNKLLATGSRNGEVSIWDLQTGQKKAECKGHSGSILGLAFFAQEDSSGDSKKKKDEQSKSPTNWMLASSATDDEDGRGELFVWEATAGKLTKKLSTEKTPPLSRVLVAGDKLLVGSADGRIQVWNTKDLVEVDGFDWQHPSKRPVLSMAVSADGEQVVSGDDKGHVYLWDLPTKRQIKGQEGTASPFKKQQGAIRALAISPNGIVASASSNHTIRFWRLHQRSSTWELHVLGEEVNDLAFDPLTNSFASATSQGTVRLWDIEPTSKDGSSFVHRERFAFTEHVGPVRKVGYANAGLALISVGHDGKVHIRRRDRNPDLP